MTTDSWNHCFHNHLWASASEPAGSVPATQSQEMWGLSRYGLMPGRGDNNSDKIQKKEWHMVWHDTQCCGWPGMGEMTALQSHHPQSHSTFWTPCTVSKPDRTCQHHEIGRAGKNTSALIHTRLFLTHEGWVDGLILTSVDDHPMTLTSTQSINQTHPLSLSFNPHSTCPGLRSWCDRPHLSFWDCVDGTLPAGSLTDAHTIWLW